MILVPYKTNIKLRAIILNKTNIKLRAIISKNRRRGKRV